MLPVITRGKEEFAVREYIAKRLNEMENSEERAFLKQVITDLFLPMYDATEEKYTALERRVRDELPLVYESYTIYSTVMPKSRADGSHSYLSPVIPSDADETVLDFGELAAALHGGQPVIDTVFCEADYFECRRIGSDKQIFNGAFTVRSERYPFKCVLKPAARYGERAEALYGMFIRNDVPWTTVNSAYFGKFFDVCLTELPNVPPRGVRILPEQIEISFAPHDGIVKRGLIPVWNIDAFHVKGEDFPMPAEDFVNYEYRFNTGAPGDGNGFLLDYANEHILNVRREGNALVIVSPKQKGFAWDMFRIRRRQDSPMDVFPYPVLSNARSDSFSARLMARYGTHIATRAELYKLLASFEVSEYAELVDLRFAGEKLPGDTYDMNPFIRDEIRNPDYQKTLSLVFKAKDRDFFLNRDIISFLVSELQSVYPEYRCVGALI
jgi:hypothetical protein